MNPIQILSSQPWVERLGWTLVHFLWQGLLIAALYAGARRCAALKSSPSSRYLLAGIALAAMMAAPLVTWSVMRPSGAIPDPAYRVRAVPLAVPVITPTTSSASAGMTVSGIRPAQFLPWVPARAGNGRASCCRTGMSKWSTSRSR